MSAGEPWVDEVMHPLRGGKYKLPARIGNRIYGVVMEKPRVHAETFVRAIVEALDNAAQYRIEEVSNPDGVMRIARERWRQVAELGWSPEHDAEHTDASLALVAALYATPVSLYRQARYANSVSFADAWPDSWAKRFDARPHKGNVLQGNTDQPVADRVRQLEKAGALIAAEIDRLLRGGEADG